MKSLQFRRVTRFSLRTLFLLMTALAVWLGIHVRQTKLQKQSVAAISDYGGWVRYDFRFSSGEYSHKDFDPQASSIVPRWALDKLGVDFFHSVVQVNLNYSTDTGVRQENYNPSDEALQHLSGLPNLRVLLLSDTQARDESLRHLARLKKLEHLYMWDVSKVSDAGVAHLRNLRNLKYIHISSSKITDESLAVFGKMPKLEGLSLQFNSFSDAGLDHLSPLSGLTHLAVCGRRSRRNPITDAGLKHLEGLQGLESLLVQNTNVTTKGVESFLQAVPRCKVTR